jgi:hypothetical protein
MPKMKRAVKNNATLIQAHLDGIKGLTMPHAHKWFYRNASDRDRKIAAMVDTQDERFEIDGAIVSEGDENGAYVMGWRWVSFEGTDLDKEKASAKNIN